MNLTNQELFDLRSTLDLKSYRQKLCLSEEGTREISEWAGTANHAQPLLLILGGETTVTVKGSGKGGRNQEMALSTCIHLEKVWDAGSKKFSAGKWSGLAPRFF